MKQDRVDNILAWISGEALVTGVLMFSGDLLKALLLGLVGGIGGLLGRWIWKKIEKKYEL